MTTNNAYRAAARRLYERDGEIEVEEFAQVEDADGRDEGDDLGPGCWVEGWLFVPDEEAAKESAGGVELVCADVPGFLKHRVPLANGHREGASRP